MSHGMSILCNFSPPPKKKKSRQSSVSKEDRGSDGDSVTMETGLSLVDDELLALSLLQNS
jgi:hypothetical protein